MKLSNDKTCLRFILRTKIKRLREITGTIWHPFCYFPLCTYACEPKYLQWFCVNSGIMTSFIFFVLFNGISLISHTAYIIFVMRKNTSYYCHVLPCQFCLNPQVVLGPRKMWWVRRWQNTEKQSRPPISTGYMGPGKRNKQRWTREAVGIGAISLLQCLRGHQTWAH